LARQQYAAGKRAAAGGGNTHLWVSRHLSLAAFAPQLDARFPQQPKAM
jgi:hypothetical protein